jgi:hypothetical protein
MSGLSKIKEAGFLEFLKALRDSESVVSLDLRRNSLSEGALGGLLSALAGNWVLSEVLIDLKSKQLPAAAAVGFSQAQALLSMYQTFVTREAVYL